MSDTVKNSADSFHTPSCLRRYYRAQLHRIDITLRRLCQAMPITYSLAPIGVPPKVGFPVKASSRPRSKIPRSAQLVDRFGWGQLVLRETPLCGSSREGISAGSIFSTQTIEMLLHAA